MLKNVCNTKNLIKKTPQNLLQQRLHFEKYIDPFEQYLRPTSSGGFTALEKEDAYVQGIKDAYDFINKTQKTEPTSKLEIEEIPPSPIKPTKPADIFIVKVKPDINKFPYVVRKTKKNDTYRFETQREIYEHIYAKSSKAPKFTTFQSSLSTALSNQEKINPLQAVEIPYTNKEFSIRRTIPKYEGPQVKPGLQPKKLNMLPYTPGKPNYNPPPPGYPPPPGFFKGNKP